MLKPYIVYMHLKDAQPYGTVVPSGYENGNKNGKLFLDDRIICEDLLNNEEKFYWGKGHEILSKKFL